MVAPLPSKINLSLLSSLGLNIVQPPRHIFTILDAVDIKINALILSPSSLHSALVEGYKTGCWKRHDPQNVDQIIEFLVFSSSPPRIDNLIGLPWFKNCKGSSVALKPIEDSDKPLIVPASQEESRIFADILQMLAWDSLSENLRHILLDPQSSRILSVVRLGCDDVLHVITTRFSRNGDVAASFNEYDVTWVLDFWTWFVDWRISDQRQFLDKKSELTNLYLLPTTSGLLRRVSGKVLLLSMDELSTAVVWEKLGVPHLHRSLSNRVTDLFSNENFIEAALKPNFIQFLLENTNPKLQSELHPGDLEIIRKSIYSASLSNLVMLGPQQKQVLEQLSIFHVRNFSGGAPFLGPITGNRFQVAVGDDFPFPYQNVSVIYIDIRDAATKELIQLLEPMKEIGVFDLLGIALEHWSLQPLELQDQFIDHILDSWTKLPDQIRNKLENLPFVTVNGLDSRVPPKKLIHPNAIITPLYESEIGRIPTGRFAVNPYLNIMHSLGFFPSSLDQYIVQERLRYLSENGSDDPKAFEKAVTFVLLLERFWDKNFRETINLFRDRFWLPRTASTSLLTPNETRDSYQGEHADPCFYDLVLTVLRSDVVFVTNPHFRSALGWSSRVPIDILVRQLVCTLALPRDKSRYERLSKLIAYMSRLHQNGQLSSEDIQSVRMIVMNVSWIPAAASSTETVATEYALLSDIDLKPPFRQVHRIEFRSFLLAMGCTDKLVSL